MDNFVHNPVFQEKHGEIFVDNRGEKVQSLLHFCHVQYRMVGLHGRCADVRRRKQDRSYTV